MLFGSLPVVEGLLFGSLLHNDTWNCCTPEIPKVVSLKVHLNGPILPRIQAKFLENTCILYCH